MKMASWRPKDCGCNVPLINFILHKKFVLNYKFIYFIDYWKPNGSASPKREHKYYV